MADGSISRRENIQFEALLDIYSEKLPELEKCIRKSKIHQKDCVMMMTYFTLAVGITGLLALFVPSTISGTTAIVACSILVNLLFIGILKAWGHSVGDLQKIPVIAKYIFIVFCYIAVIGFYGYLTFKVSPDTAVIMIFFAPSILVFLLSISNMIDWICTPHSNHQKGSIQAVNEKLHANGFLNYQMKESTSSNMPFAFYSSCQSSEQYRMLRVYEIVQLMTWRTSSHIIKSSPLFI
ncbi:hypothetical protein CRE_11689 [Caenorhabditis remanei]|uniref:Uncharacterized protein n=1 Tax=Caenorhabditis remanei TaxID=31234 RepID=E3M450_CAERE|nr:hypothetical protein CRE_11689 [Caenorhabditis remanei]